MAYDKVIDSAQLNTAMIYTANRIRNKTGGTDQIAWDSAKGFGDAVDTITSGFPRRSLIRERFMAAHAPPSGLDCRIMTRLNRILCIYLSS